MGSDMKAHIVAIALGALVLGSGPCVAQSGPGEGPIKPGSTRVTTRAPEPEKWDAQRSANGAQRIFRCKPLACADAQTVSFRFSKNPTRTPDPEALEKFAKIDLPKSIRAAGAAREVLSDGTEKIETLVSKSATLKGYPSVVNESKFSRGQASSYIQTAIIFAGSLLIRVQSTSPNQELAHKALEEFVEIMRIEEGPPAPPPQNPRPPRLGTQDL
jgi:hypothetical protein